MGHRRAARMAALTTRHADINHRNCLETSRDDRRRDQGIDGRMGRDFFWGHARYAFGYHVFATLFRVKTPSRIAFTPSITLRGTATPSCYSVG